MRFTRLAIAACVAGLGACERPEWTDPERSKGPRTPPPPVALARGAIPVSERAAPPLPAWARPLAGRRFAEVFKPGLACNGTVDALQQRFTGSPAGSELVGWAWFPERTERAERIALVGPDGLIAGAGEGGLPRPDVSAAVPRSPPDLGWSAVTPLTSGHVEVFAVDPSTGEACPLGRAEL